MVSAFIGRTGHCFLVRKLSVYAKLLVPLLLFQAQRFCIPSCLSGPSELCLLQSHIIGNSICRSNLLSSPVPATSPKDISSCRPFALFSILVQSLESLKASKIPSSSIQARSIRLTLVNQVLSTVERSRKCPRMLLSSRVHLSVENVDIRHKNFKMHSLQSNTSTLSSIRWAKSPTSRGTSHTIARRRLF